MRSAVRACFYAFNAPMEGEVNHLYVDVKGLVSIGVGHLVDPLAYAIQLPLKRSDGTLASRDEIVADWAAVKNGPDFARLGHRAAARVVRLHLTKEDLGALLLAKLDQNDTVLRRRFPDFETWPSDAQLAAHSLSWACGPHFRFPKLEAALLALDFVTSSVEVFMPEEATISGLRPRNRANRLLFRNAAYVVVHGLDRDVLHWPNDAATDEDDTPTQPEIRLDLLESERPPAPFDIVHRSPYANDDDPPPDAA